jgi:hypothetical protein
MTPSRSSPPCDFAQASGVEIGEELGVSLAVDLRQQLLHVADFSEVTHPEIIIRRHCECAEMAQPARDVLDEFVQTENLHQNENDRRVLHAGGPREVNRHIAARNFDLGVAGINAVAVGMDGIGAHRSGGERIARGRGGRTRHKSESRQRRHDFG